MLDRVELGVALAATIVAVGLRLHAFRHVGALWRDEINTANLIASPTLASLWRGLEFESFPVLFPFVLRGWAAIAGDSDAALRVLGLLGGLSIIAAAWLVAANRSRPPVLALALLAVNPEIIRWGSSVRAFGWAAGLATAALVLLVAAAGDRSRRRWAVVAIVVLATMQCLYQNAILVAAAVFGVGLAALLRRDQGSAAWAAAVGLAGAASLLPYLETIARVSRWSDVNQSAYAPGFLLGKAWASVAAGGVVPGAAFGLLAGAGIAAGVFAAATQRRSEADGSRAVAFGASGVAAALGFAVFVLQLGLPTQSWYYLGVIAFVAIAADAALGMLRSTAVRVASLGIALVVLATGVGPAVTALRARNSNADAVAVALDARARPGDLVVVSPWYLVFGVDRYYRGPAAVVTVPPLADTSLHRYDLLRQTMSSPGAIEPLIGRIEEVLSAGGRVYVAGRLPPSRLGWSVPDLPPPPLPDTGWNAAPYLFVWSSRVGAFLLSHSTESSLVPVEHPGGPLENIALREYQGFRP